MDRTIIQFFQQFVTPYILSISAGLTAAGIRSLLDGVDFSRVRRSFPVDVLEEAMATLAGDNLVPDGLTWREIAQKTWSELGVGERRTSTILYSPQRFDGIVATVLSSAGVPVTHDYVEQLKKLTILNVLRYVAREGALAPEITVDILIALGQRVSDVEKLIKDLRGDLSCMLAFQSIEAVLAKKREVTPDFFREAGPLWTDFDAGLVASRPDEMRKIVQSIEESRCCYVTGPSGSGKTVLAKTLGYELSRKGWFVFCARATTVSLVDMWREISRWDKKQFLFIVDDCEDDPDLAHEILVRFAGLENCVLLLLSRVSPEQETRSDLSFAPQPPVNAKPTRRLVADVVAICERYLVELEGYDQREIQNAEEDVKALWRACGPDLWIVKWFLRSWDPRKSQLRFVSKEQVYRRIAEERLDSPSERSILLAVSALSQIGVRSAESYLYTRGSGVDLEQLVRRGILTRDLSPGGFVYAVHHPSPARLYLEAAGRFGMLPLEVEREMELDEKVQLYIESTARAYLVSNLSQLPKAVPVLHRIGCDRVIVDLLSTESQRLAFLDELTSRSTKLQRRVLRSLLDIRPGEQVPKALVSEILLETIAGLAKEERGHRLLITLDPHYLLNLYELAREVDDRAARDLVEAWLLGQDIPDTPKAAIRRIERRFFQLRKLERVIPGLANRYLKHVSKIASPSTLALSAISRPTPFLIMLPKLYRVDASFGDAVMENIDTDQLQKMLVHQDVNTLSKLIRFSSRESAIALWEALGDEGRKAIVANSSASQLAHGIRYLAEIEPNWAQELLEQSVDRFFKAGEPLPSVSSVQSLVWAATEGALDLPHQVLSALTSDHYRDKLAETDIRTLALLMHHLAEYSPKTYERIATHVSQLDLASAISTNTLENINGFLWAMRFAGENVRYSVASQVVQADISRAIEEGSLRDIAFLIYDSLCLSEEVARALAEKWISVPLVKSKAANASLEDCFWMVWDAYQASLPIAIGLLSDSQFVARIHAELWDGPSWLVRPALSTAMVGLLDLYDEGLGSRIDLLENIPATQIAQWISAEDDPSLIALSIAAIHPRTSPVAWSEFVTTLDCQLVEELLATPPSIRAKEIFDRAVGLLSGSKDRPKS